MTAGSVKARASVVSAVEEAVQGDDATRIGDELFSLVRLLDSEPTLRRVLTDPSVPAEAKGHLVDSLLDDRVSAPTGQVVDTAVGLRWPHPRDLADALEYAGVIAHIAKAEQDDDLDAVEDDLFRFSRIVAASRQLRDTLGDRLAPQEAKRRLVDALLADKVGPTTKALVSQAVTGRGGQLSTVLQRYEEIAAERRQRLVATVRVAAPLSDDHLQRLADALRRVYGKQIHVNVIVDEAVLGGVRVQVGDEVIDSTISTRLAEAERRLTG
jgi:F-type H+-transporting ATPase subunit delta